MDAYTYYKKYIEENLFYASSEKVLQEAQKLLKRTKDLSEKWRIKRLIGEYMNGEITLNELILNLRQKY